jgi:hypothetical protein
MENLIREVKSLGNPYGKKGDSYYIFSPTDTFFLVKSDTVKIVKDFDYDQTGHHVAKEDSRYKGILKMLAMDYPEISSKAYNVYYRPKEIQNYFHMLNQRIEPETAIKRKSDTKTNFLKLDIKGLSTDDLQNYGFELMIVGYDLHFSPNISVRYGINGFYILNPHLVYNPIYLPNYLDAHTLKFKYLTPESEVRYVYGVQKQIYALEFPVLVNLEFANSYLTPFLTVGISPMFCASDIYLHENNDKRVKFFLLTVRTAFGLKVKITKHLNVYTEAKIGHLSILNFGIAYHFPFLRK